MAEETAGSNGGEIADERLEEMIDRRLMAMESQLWQEAERRLAPRDEAIQARVEMRMEEMHERVDEMAVEITEQVEADLQPTQEDIEEYVERRKEELRESIREELINERD